MTYRLIPANGAAKTEAVFGRTYTAAANGFVDAPDGDAFVLSANGWAQVAQVGTTVNRPTHPRFGQKFVDTTLNLIVVWEGSAWRNPASGAVA
jgi:hypothetical protein